MSELWQEVGLAVVEGEHDAREVAAALPVASSIAARAPQRHALAATIHVGDANGPNTRRWATFVAGGRTFVAPPGGVSTRTGETAFVRALSARFGVVRWFGISFAAPEVAAYSGGAPTEHTRLADEDAVLARLADHLGVVDARAILSVPGGEAVILETEAPCR